MQHVACMSTEQLFHRTTKCYCYAAIQLCLKEHRDIHKHLPNMHVAKCKPSNQKKKMYRISMLHVSLGVFLPQK